MNIFSEMGELKKFYCSLYKRKLKEKYLKMRMYFYYLLMIDIYLLFKSCLFIIETSYLLALKV